MSQVPRDKFSLSLVERYAINRYIFNKRNDLVYFGMNCEFLRAIQSQLDVE